MYRTVIYDRSGMLGQACKNGLFNGNGESDYPYRG